MSLQETRLKRSIVFLSKKQGVSLGIIRQEPIYVALVLQCFPRTPEAHLTSLSLYVMIPWDTEDHVPRNSYRRNHLIQELSNEFVFRAFAGERQISRRDREIELSLRRASTTYVFKHGRQNGLPLRVFRFPHVQV